MIQDPHPLPERFHGLLKEVGELHDNTRAQRGTIEDPYNNLHAAEDWGIEPWADVMVRVSDWVRQLQAHAVADNVPDDAHELFLKIAVGALVASVLYEEAEARTPLDFDMAEAVRRATQELREKLEKNREQDDDQHQHQEQDQHQDQHQDQDQPLDILAEAERNLSEEVERMARRLSGNKEER